ncbi:uncharacterized protein [Dermacentor albipictus]|uniref:uncharacterized protein isoform X1 n=1 Tax=Dermacentor albipictus TaxID=60249 RepID=UPI0038FC0ED2
MAYVIAEFVEDKQVEVVPVTWVEGDKCAWPDNLKGNRVTSLVKKSVPPDTFWKCYSVAVKGVFATYEQARAKLNDSQYTSDLGTGSEMSQGKRTRRPPAQWSDSDEPDTPPPPKKAKQSSSKQIPAPPSNFPLGLSSASAVQQDSCEESEGSLQSLSADVNDMPQGGAGGPSSHSANGSRSHTAGGSSSHSDQRTCVPSGSPDELSNNIAARRMTEGSTNDIEDTIKSWLRHAPERAGSHKKPSAEVCLPQE